MNINEYKMLFFNSSANKLWFYKAFQKRGRENENNDRKITHPASTMNRWHFNEFNDISIGEII